MTPKKQGSRGILKKKTRGKAKPSKPVKAHSTPRKVLAKASESIISIKPPVRIESHSREVVRMTLDNIRVETAIGDLLVAFPRTREVLVKNGLRLEAENAGDIYMTIEAFSALNGLRAENLVQDLIVIAREPPSQPSVSHLAIPATL